MIVIAVGSNLVADGFQTPLATCEAAVARLAAEPGIAILARSRWYESEPVPVSNQPWYVNGAICACSTLDPKALLERLHAIEASFGRVRRARNEPRPLDLDLIDHHGQIRGGGDDGGPILPHPRAHERAFVLLPLAEIVPGWHHPVSGAGVAELIAMLPPGSPAIRPLEAG